MVPKTARPPARGQIQVPNRGPANCRTAPLIVKVTGLLGVLVLPPAILELRPRLLLSRKRLKTAVLNVWPKTAIHQPCHVKRNLVPLIVVEVGLPGVVAVHLAVPHLKLNFTTSLSQLRLVALNVLMNMEKWATNKTATLQHVRLTVLENGLPGQTPVQQRVVVEE